MNNFAHAYLLDGLCRMRPSDSPDYTSNHIKIYSHINQIGAFQVLQDTPHFQGFIKYLVANANVRGFCCCLLAPIVLPFTTSLLVLAPGARIGPARARPAGPTGNQGPVRAVLHSVVLVAITMPAPCWRCSRFCCRRVLHVLLLPAPGSLRCCCWLHQMLPWEHESVVVCINMRNSSS